MPVPPRLRLFVCVFACVLCVLCVSFLHENHEYWRILFWERCKGDCTPCLPSSLLAPPPAVSLPMPPNLVCLKLFLCAVAARLSVSYRVWCIGRLAAEDALGRMDDAVARTEERESCLRCLSPRCVVWQIHHLRRLFRGGLDGQAKKTSPQKNIQRSGSLLCFIAHFRSFPAA